MFCFFFFFFNCSNASVVISHLSISIYLLLSRSLSFFFPFYFFPLSIIQKNHAVNEMFAHDDDVHGEKEERWDFLPTHTHAEQVSELNWLWVNSSAFLIISFLRDVHNTKIYRYVLYVHHTRIYACLKYSIQVVVSFSSEMVFLLFLFSGSRFRFLIDLKGLFFSTSYDYYVVPCETNDTTFGLLLL